MAKAGSPICRLRRLDACTKREEAPGVSTFDAIDTCGNFVIGQDAQALRVEWENGGPTWVDMGPDPAGETRYPGRQGDRGWAIGEVRCRSREKPSEC